MEKKENITFTSNLIELGKVDEDGNVFSKDCVFNIPRYSPILTWNFDQSKPLGVVEDIKETESGVVANISLNRDGVDFIKKFLNFEVGGRVIERKGKEITKFHLWEVALTLKK